MSLDKQQPLSAEIPQGKQAPHDKSHSGENTAKTIGDVIRDLRELKLQPKERGRKFEVIVKETLPSLPEYEIDKVWDFADWAERQKLMKQDAKDLGIDLVARRHDGGWVAIQCKCWDSKQKVQLGDLKSFTLSAAPADHFKFAVSYLITTCGIGNNAEANLNSKGIRWVPYHTKHKDEPVDRVIRQKREPHPQQTRAIQLCTQGLTNYDKGQLIMACGTGKTFTALRIAEEEALDAKRVLFVAPSISLVGQARREWLKCTQRRLANLIVCSDSSTGKATKEGSSSIDILELECPVTTSPPHIAKFLKAPAENVRLVVFCTYQSLDKVSEAQKQHGAPLFDLAIVDEAHRTVGVKHNPEKENLPFTAIHNDDFVQVRKRLYMTATPKVYTPQSKETWGEQGIVLVDTGDIEVFGPEFFRLKFKDAVNPKNSEEEPLLSDYRVIVLGIREEVVSKKLSDRFKGESAVEQQGLSKSILKAQGVALALNGEIEGVDTSDQDLPGRLHASIGFCNRIKVSRWYADVLQDSKLKELTTRRLPGEGSSVKIDASHLDGNSSAHARTSELESLRMSRDNEECRVLMNAKLFSEGVDVPTLDAVIFMEPRKSQIDVVQAVGRVMRKAENKRLGYIIIPAVIPTGEKGIEALLNDAQGYQSIGKVLAALQSHDERLAEAHHRLIKYVEIDSDEEHKDSPSGEGEGGDIDEEDTLPLPWQLSLFDENQTKKLFARLMDKIGLGDKGLVNANEIVYSVEGSAQLLDKAGAAETLGKVLDIPFDASEKNRKHICTTAALLVQNACLLHKRLCELPHMEALRGIDELGSEADPIGILLDDWEAILQRDYTPIFNPALRVLKALPDREEARQGIMGAVQCANNLASELGDFGWDHAGPLYHKILGSAESDGAFYTKNVAALLLAKLAINKHFLNWSDPKVLDHFKMIDPACGTGTLLMAAVKTLKDRLREASESNADADADAEIHKHLVEQGVYALDINEHAIQLAASNLTLGAPNVDYQRMNLYPMPHGMGKDGNAQAGSLELLAGNRPYIERQKDDTIEQAGGRQIDGARRGDASDVVGQCDLVVMNPPFTNNVKRSTRFGREYKEAMSKREKYLKEEVKARQGLSASDVINANSVSTFFTPLADKLLKKDSATLAKVMPATACTSTSGLAERKWLAQRFHIEYLVTSHTKKDFSFSGNTSIHECLMVCRRSSLAPHPPTKIAVLRKMPANAEEAEHLSHLIEKGDLREWGACHNWPAEKIKEGDWSAVQWFDGELADIAAALNSNEYLKPVGPRPILSGQQVRGTFTKYGDGETHNGEGETNAFYTTSAKTRDQIRGQAEQAVQSREGKQRQADYCLQEASHFLVATKLNTQSGALTGIYSDEPSIGSGWVPVWVNSSNEAKALSVWWNSTFSWLLLLNNRTTILTWPAWSLAQLRTIPIPNFAKCDMGVLIKAFDTICDKKLKPMREQKNDPARHEIDKAAAQICHIDEGLVADWRDRLAKEPTISGN